MKTDTPATATPTVNDILPPDIALENISLPSGSVPNHISGPGGFILFMGFIAMGSPVKKGPINAIKAKIAKITQKGYASKRLHRNAGIIAAPLRN